MCLVWFFSLALLGIGLGGCAESPEVAEPPPIVRRPGGDGVVDEASQRGPAALAADVDGAILGLRLHGQLDNHPNPHFVITDLEEIPMNAYASEFTPDLTVPGLSPEMALEDDHDSGATFDDLPLSLTLNCGRLSLTLGELRTLGAGSVLTLTQGTPGLAMLCHDDRPLAHGELVDVDGHIGLQITRLELGR